MATLGDGIVGYFNYDCQADGYCTYGCGKEPNLVCLDCVDDQAWLEGTTVPDNWHGVVAEYDDELEEFNLVGLVCGICDEAF